ncbi:MAG TPA: adenine phosphoribosyltransferase [Humidesulfovibrio sp.]|uniref:adenine phosphoribosyltransferase n=1 Tax=Humidesulfovibrio sp. TaxID=2910988 RepID=UPI002CFCB581|nr:adenine phosphoribosyltransferase [Humidesulfovibrio sp.]HWR02723.1 adenine phosphoribosyltransferase [Humidesulfovibrio sp.]
MDLRSYIRDVLDFKPGITFFDITPLLAEPAAFRYAIDALAERYKDSGATKILAAEARGFLFGAPLAYKMNLGFIPVRKPGKLPYKTSTVTYDLEYGTDSLQMHVDAVKPGDRILIIDDLLATGGTTGGMIKLVKDAGADIAGIGFLIELGFLDGASKLDSIPHEYLLKL